ncbi:MAG: hypothetical protein AAGF81_14050 [Pseudomonadota bacterium]
MTGPLTTRPSVRLSFKQDVDEMFEAANRCFLDNGPEIAPFLDLEFSSSIQVMRDNGFSVPTFIYAGPDSAAAKFFGEEFARNCAGLPGVPDREFALSVCDSYKELSWDRRKPILEQMTRKVAGKTIQFERGLWPVMSGNDTPAVVCFIKPLRVFREIPQTATPDRLAPST